MNAARFAGRPRSRKPLQPSAWHPRIRGARLVAGGATGRLSALS